MTCNGCREPRPQVWKEDTPRPGRRSERRALELKAIQEHRAALAAAAAEKAAEK